MEIGRNDPCHCGSGKKYKKCHLAEDQVKESKLLKKTQFAPRPDAETEKKGHSHKPDAGAKKSWLKNVMGKVGMGPSARKAPSGPSGSGG
jgi:hypothetical protein